METGRKRQGLKLSILVLAVLSALAMAAPQAFADYDNNGSYETAEPLQVNQSVTGKVDQGKDQDYYVVNVPTNGTVYLSFSSTAEGEKNWWTVGLTQPDVDGITSMYITEGDSNMDARSPMQGIARGTYYVVVSSHESTAMGCSYTLTVNFAAADNWEAERNNSSSSATDILLNRTINARSMDRYDDDWYHFSLVNDGYIQIQFTNDKHSTGNWTMSLYGGSENGAFSGLPFVYDDMPANIESRITPKVGLPKGDYLIHINPDMEFLDENFNYTLKVCFTEAHDWETERNDTVSTADPLEIGVGKRGTFERNTGAYADWYRFEVGEAGTYQVALAADAEPSGATYAGKWSAVVRDSSGDKGFSWNTFSADVANHKGTTFELEPGTYTLELTYRSYFQDASGNYGNDNLNGLEYTLSVQKVGGSDSDGQQGGSQQPSQQTQVMHRLYNRWTGEHFYTASAKERDSLVKAGWTSEGTGWVAPKSGTPVYRLYNPYAPGGDHHYTTDKKEYDELKRLGWRQEGIGWYSGGSVPVYRQYNPYAVTGTHNYTTDRHENDELVRLGWRAEGTGWYAVSAQ